MKLSKALQGFVELAKAGDTYWIEQAKLDFSMALEKRRLASRMTYAAIAKKIGTSAAYITKVFRGDSNLTIESMVKLARSTGGKLNIQIIDEEADAKRWVSTLAAYGREAANQPLTTPTTGTTGTGAAIYHLSDYTKDKDAIAA